MKKVFLFSIILFLSLPVFSQSACTTYNGDYNQILSELVNRNTATGRNKLGEGHLKSIAKYWQSVCKCENGAQSEAEASQLYKDIFENTTHYTDTYLDHGVSKKKDPTPFGDLYPTSKIYTKSKCLEGGSGVSMADAIGCVPEAQSFLNNASDSQQYGKAFFRAYCECKSGVGSQERANQLVVEMKENHKNFHTYKASSDPTISTQPLNNCSITSSNGFSQTVDYEKGVIVKDEYISLLNDIAADTKNLHFKGMVNELNENRDAFAQGRSLAMNFGGISQSDIDQYNFLENATQVFAIGKFLFNSISGKLTPEQEAGRKIIKKINSQLSEIYNEANAVPTFFDFNETMMQKLKAIEGRIEKYERATATRRLMFLEYWQTKPYMTSDQVVARFSKIESLLKTNGSDYVVDLVNKRDNDFKTSDFNHIVNKDYGFRTTFNRIDLNKAKYYESNGDKNKAEELRANINYDVNNFDAFKLLQEAFKDKNYYATSQYYEQVKNTLEINEEGKSFFLFYKDIPNIDYSYDGMWRHETTYLLALGILSYSKSGEIAQAQAELDFLKWYNENHRVFNEQYEQRKLRKKANGFSDVEYASSYAQCLAIEKAVEAVLLSKNGETEKAEKLIDEAVALNLEYPTNTNRYGTWYALTKLEILIRNNNFIEARKLAVKIRKTAFLASISQKFYNEEDFKFLLAFMKFKQEQYQSVINELTILEQSNPKSKRIMLLKLDTYKALGDSENETLYQSKLSN